MLLQEWMQCSIDHWDMCVVLLVCNHDRLCLFSWFERLHTYKTLWCGSWILCRGKNISACHTCDRQGSFLVLVAVVYDMQECIALVIPWAGWWWSFSWSFVIQELFIFRCIHKVNGDFQRCDVRMSHQIDFWKILYLEFLQKFNTFD
jgi:hypothetical protein